MLLLFGRSAQGSAAEKRRRKRQLLGRLPPAGGGRGKGDSDGRRMGQEEENRLHMFADVSSPPLGWGIREEEEEDGWKM